MKEIVRQYVLKNALEFSGKVNSNAVLGLVLKEQEKLRQEVPKVRTEIEKAVKEIEGISVAEIKKRLQKLVPELAEKKEEVVPGPLKPLPKAEIRKVVVRIAPSPSGPLHIGHAYGLALNAAYAEMYQGKLLLRIEDTNPENIYAPAYELIERDAQWLSGNKVAQVIVQSSRLGTYYDYAEQLIQKQKAYVCTCNADEFKEKKNKGIACPCRNLPLKEQQQRFAKLFSSYAEGEAVVRLKTDIKDKNPAMRDFGIMRIVEHIHPKTGKEQRVWPLMVFSVAVDDHEMGVTHVLNGKDHADNALKEKMIMEDLGWKVPEYKHWGRINFEGFELSTSKTRLAIEQGKYTGWEDIRLPFLPALRKRGYQPEAFRRFALEMGLSLNDKNVSIEEFWKSINSFNKDIIESKANRYFFIDQPVKVKIEKAPPEKVQLDLHPDFPQRGKRTLMAKGTFYISNSDVEKLKPGCIHRLMDYGNFELKGKKYEFVSEPYEEYKNAANRGMIIHWLPVQETIEAEVMMDDGTIVKGIAEPGLAKMEIGEIVQLERRFFARIEKKEKNKIVLWYLHK